MSRLFPLLKHFSMRALPWLLSALVASAVTVGAMLPAAWFTPAVARITHNRVHLTAPSGSVWRGSAMLMFSAGAHAFLALAGGPHPVELARRRGNARPCCAGDHAENRFAGRRTPEPSCQHLHRTRRAFQYARPERRNTA